MRIVNSTIAFNQVTNTPNGGGVLVAGSEDKFRIDNTIIAENLAIGVANNISGSVNSSSSYNLIGYTGTAGLTHGLNGNIVLTPGQSAGLTALGYYGGTTKTHALLSSSLAIDAGDNAVAVAYGLETDQRSAGYDRIVDWDEDLDVRVDIGAFELALEEVYT